MAGADSHLPTTCHRKTNEHAVKDAILHLLKNITYMECFPGETRHLHSRQPWMLW
jgi:hypothetical protein